MASTWWRMQAACEGHALQWPVHGRPATIAGCDVCGSLWRTQPSDRDVVADWYRHDRYDEDTLRRLHDLAYQAFVADAAWLSTHLTPGDRVLEIGSYVGGFLRYATELGCAAIGVDVGDDSRDFCRRLGYDVHTEDEIDRIAAADQTAFDSVWVLNCFDQLPDPAGALLQARTLVRHGCRLVIRTPDASAVQHAYRLGGDHTLRALRSGLWAVPFLNCFSEAGIASLLRRCGFDVIERRSRISDGGDPSGWFDVVATTRPT